MSNKNFAFDERVAKRYNAQRAHPAQVSEQIGATIAQQANDNAPILEIGVGTGRIALPVVEAGKYVVGIDISTKMMQEVFQANEASSRALDLLQADMHHLPFADNRFAAVTAVHVLHLASDWQRTLHEIARVLKPDGVFIQGDDWIDPQSVVGRLRDELRMRVASMAPHLRPPAANVSREQVLAALGGTDVDEIIAAEWTIEVSPADRLAEIENRIDAESWILKPELFETVLQQLRDYATATWPDLLEKQPVTRRFVLKVTRGQWQ